MKKESSAYARHWGDDNNKWSGNSGNTTKKKLLKSITHFLASLYRNLEFHHGMGPEENGHYVWLREIDQLAENSDYKTNAHKALLEIMESVEWEATAEERIENGELPGDFPIEEDKPKAIKKDVLTVDMMSEKDFNQYLND